MLLIRLELFACSVYETLFIYPPWVGREFLAAKTLKPAFWAVWEVPTFSPVFGLNIRCVDEVLDYYGDVTKPLPGVEP